MWSFVQSKQQQRWLWHAVKHNSGAVLAYVLAPHHDEAFVRLKTLLKAFGLPIFTVMGGELMNAISMLIFILFGNAIPRKLNESI